MSSTYSPPRVARPRLAATAAELAGHFAVATAGALGGRVMVAQVQVANVRFFERLGWVREGDAALYCGVMHQPMAIVLSAASG